MRKFTAFFIAICMMPLLASAQSWTFEGGFPDTTQYGGFGSVHGLAVDGDGKVWVMPYYPYLSTETTLTASDGSDSTATVSTGGIFVYNADGTPNDTLMYAPQLGDTLGGGINADGDWEWNSGRGMRYDPVNDQIYAVFYQEIFKIDATTHEVTAKALPEGGSKAAPAFDGEGNVYIAPVVGANAAIKKFDSNLEYVEDVGAPGGSFSRSFEVTDDGTVYWAGYTNGYVLKWAKPDAFSPYQSTPDTVLRGIKSESFAIHPTTGRLWVSAGSPNDLPGISPTTGYAYDLQTWYAFNFDDLGTANEIPVDSLKWTIADGDTDTDGRPRVMAWEEDGETVYVAQFSQDIPAVQKYTGSPVVSVESELTDGMPEGYELKSNYPNPFNPTTNIEFNLAESGFVQLNVYNMLGQKVAEVASGDMSAGKHTVTFNASALSSGTYLYTLEVNGVRLTNKMTLIK